MYAYTINSKTVSTQTIEELAQSIVREDVSTGATASYHVTDEAGNVSEFDAADHAELANLCEYYGEMAIA